MERYKKSLVFCCVKVTVLSILLIAVYVLFATTLMKPAFPSMETIVVPEVKDMLLGAVCAFVAVQVIFVFSTLRILKKPEAIASKYRKTGDERKMLIQQKTGSFACIGTLFTLLMGAVIAGAYNITVCFTLFGVIGVVMVLYSGALLFYSKKY